MMGCGSAGDGADGRKVPVVAAGVSRSVASPEGRFRSESRKVPKGPERSLKEGLYLKLEETYESNRFLLVSVH